MVSFYCFMFFSYFEAYKLINEKIEKKLIKLLVNDSMEHFELVAYKETT